MPATSLALTPGLASFLKSLKTNPIDTSIENLISYGSPNHPNYLAGSQVANIVPRI